MESWVWGFVRDNLGNCALATALQRLALPSQELQFARFDDCALLWGPAALTGPTAYTLAEHGAMSKRQGSYIVLKKESGIIVRVGKAASDKRDIGVRWIEHQKCSNLKDSASRLSDFYNMYPSESSPHAKGPPYQRGYFEQLNSLNLLIKIIQSISISGCC